jgi:retron-type reverse transcriptase
VLGKNFELIIKMKLEVTANNIPEYQFGFKENHSTIHPLITLVNNVQENKKVGKKSVALFLDINKAFDSIWHKGLLYKLFKLNCPKYLVSIVKNYLEDRTLSVRINNHVSEEFKPEQGVPQGSPLAPILCQM